MLHLHDNLLVKIKVHREKEEKEKADQKHIQFEAKKRMLTPGTNKREKRGLQLLKELILSQKLFRRC